jgi:peptidoglycan/xylan/chitin deacetylase (PgdA/CDA1 family)
MPRARVVLYLATLGAFGLAVRAVLGTPPPLAWAAFFALAYVALFTAGVLFLPLAMFTDVVARGPGGARGVVLTFDDGPDPRSTPKVLDALERAGATATFFVIGQKVLAHPEVVKDIVRRGHTVGLHSFTHDRLFSLRGARRVKDDLERGLAAIERVTGERAVFFRPPVGHTNPAIARVADELDLVVVGWSVRGFDGIAADPARVSARVARGLEDGAIVLLHDAAERGDREPAGVRALGPVLEAIRDRNLTVVPLAAWTGDAANSVADG